MDEFENSVSDNTKVSLLLCGRFSSREEVNPLTDAQYNLLALALCDLKLQPSDLLADGHVVRDVWEKAAALRETQGSRVTPVPLEAIQALLQRGMALASSLTEWANRGIWVLGRSDDAYPKRYRERLGIHAPVLLYGAGEKRLLAGGGLAVVGSRDIAPSTTAFVQNAVAECVRAGMPIVSGGARGVDQTSMRSAFENGGTVIGVLAADLARAVCDSQNRDNLMEGRSLLMSPFHPAAHFDVGNAMARNKYIYAMADYALVAQSTPDGGGTWAGATEELKRKHPMPVFVHIDSEPSVASQNDGNRKLLEEGCRSAGDTHKALLWPEGAGDIRARLETAAAKRPLPTSQPGLFDGDLHVAEKVPAYTVDVSKPLVVAKAKKKVRKASEKIATGVSIYELALPTILAACTIPRTVDELTHGFVRDVTTAQLKAWLKKACGVKRLVLSEDGHYRTVGN